ncbi:hypothetical protein P5673_014163 [Acropora cervicornis]|uniref:Reverse transcriptase n=1 Tax=Acropora cervicornis TaxID=6130 RepID=A0AAD9QJI4_ACRCE|nr:hypothetical protein P5673_014163 [Acropora cervicornis]
MSNVRNFKRKFDENKARMRTKHEFCRNSLPLLLYSTESDVLKFVLGLNTNKACSPDGVTARLLCEASSPFVPSITRGDKEVVSNYTPISLICLLVKALEKLVASRISFFINSKNLLSDHHLNTNKACSPDWVTARLLCEASSPFVPSITRVFNCSLALGKLPCKCFASLHEG